MDTPKRKPKNSEYSDPYEEISGVMKRNQSILDKISQISETPSVATVISPPHVFELPLKPKAQSRKSSPKRNRSISPPRCDLDFKDRYIMSMNKPQSEQRKKKITLEELQEQLKLLKEDNMKLKAEQKIWLFKSQQAREDRYELLEALMASEQRRLKFLARHTPKWKTMSADPF